MPKRIYKAIKDPKYLGTDLKNHLAEGDIDLVLYAQRLPKDLSPEQRTKMVEDGLSVWKTEKVPVANIRLVKGGMDAKTAAITETLGWNPGNYFDKHVPLGSMGRGRVWAYFASQFGRWFDTQNAAPTNLENGQAFQPLLQEIVKKYKELNTQKVE